MRCLFVWVVLSGCGARTELFGPVVEGDDDLDAAASFDGASAGCSDADGDGFGIGADCLGPDCDDYDETVDAQSECKTRCEDTTFARPGCPCADPEPTLCYEGDPETAANAPCRAGLSLCTDNIWGPCSGQVLPSEETCDGVDDDCDGKIDEGTFNRCGDCDPECRVLCWGPAEPCEDWGDDVARLEATSSGALVVQGAGAEGGGNWRTTFECGAAATWLEVHVSAAVPERTAIDVSVRTADTREELAAGRWIDLGTLPGHAPEFRLAAILDGGALRNSFIELRVALHAGAAVSPTLRQVDLLYRCTGF